MCRLARAMIPEMMTPLVKGTAGKFYLTILSPFHQPADVTFHSLSVRNKILDISAYLTGAAHMNVRRSGI